MEREHKKGWRWIDQRIEELDPEADALEIVRLGNLYRVNDFVSHWGFAVGTPMAGINPVGADQVWRGGKSTSSSAPQRRVDDSNGHVMCWMEHGADHEATKLSIDMVNKYHAHFGKGSTSGLGDPEEYVYILCLNGSLLHILQRKLGFRGFSEKEQQAAHRVWSGIAKHFRLATDGTPVLDHAPFPDDFQGMLDKVDAWLNRPWPYSQPGHEYTTKGIEHFAQTQFPKLLLPFGRAVVTAFLPEQVLRVQGIKRPGRILRSLAVGFMKMAMFYSTRIAPDPKLNLLDRRRLAKGSSEGKPSEVDVTVHRKLDRGNRGSGLSMCPHAPIET